jgi:hypothetical protein
MSWPDGSLAGQCADAPMAHKDPNSQIGDCRSETETEQLAFFDHTFFTKSLKGDNKC